MPRDPALASKLQQFSFWVPASLDGIEWGLGGGGRQSGWQNIFHFVLDSFSSLPYFWACWDPNNSIRGVV
jgi:hypothetical protein